MRHGDWLAAVQAVDEAVLRSGHGEPVWAVPFFYAITVIGGGWGLLAIVPFVIRDATRRITLWLLGALATTNLVVELAKALVGRVRPCDALAWCPPIAVASPGGGSFPSGHAAGAFAFAAFVAAHVPRAAAPLFVFAALVAWSRCFLGVHYPSDILAGACLGTALGAMASKLSRPRGT